MLGTHCEITGNTRMVIAATICTLFAKESAGIILCTSTKQTDFTMNAQLLSRS